MTEDAATAMLGLSNRRRGNEDVFRESRLTKPPSRADDHRPCAGRRWRIVKGGDETAKESEVWEKV